MVKRYFLSANSTQGFYSLYESFPGQGVFLHIIKGGPGTGKSSFMKKLSQAAQERGLDVEEILCSGDVESLDGLYIPEIKQAWVDGTSPHVREPELFGVDADYIDLGTFCKTPLSDEDAGRARALNKEHREIYAKVYALLAQAGEKHEQLEGVYRPYMDHSSLTDYTKESIRRLFE